MVHVGLGVGATHDSAADLTRGGERTKSKRVMVGKTRTTPFLASVCRVFFGSLFERPREVIGAASTEKRESRGPHHPGGVDGTTHPLRERKGV